ERGRGPRLAIEALEELRSGMFGEFGNLKRHAPMQLRVFGQKHGAYRPLAERLQNAVTAEHLGNWWSGRRLRAICERFGGPGAARVSRRLNLLRLASRRPGWAVGCDRFGL